jgi:hypothetical protein
MGFDMGAWVPCILREEEIDAALDTTFLFNN